MSPIYGLKESAPNWTLGASIRLRCINTRCKNRDVTEIIRPMRFGNVIMTGVWRCAACLHEMEPVNAAIRQPEVESARTIAREQALAEERARAHAAVKVAGKRATKRAVKRATARAVPVR